MAEEAVMDGFGAALRLAGRVSDCVGDAMRSASVKNSLIQECIPVFL
jgi:hypothetical protein